VGDAVGAEHVGDELGGDGGAVPAADAADGDADGRLLRSGLVGVHGGDGGFDERPDPGGAGDGGPDAGVLAGQSAERRVDVRVAVVLAQVEGEVRGGRRGVAVAEGGDLDGGGHGQLHFTRA